MDAAAALLTSWRRARAATFTSEGTFHREANGATIDDVVVVVQRPPDRLTLGFGSWDGVVGGKRVTCRRDGRSGPWAACDGMGEGEVASTDEAEIARLRELVDLTDPTYRVSELDEGCFRLRLVADVRFTPEYGNRTEVCFDPATGAMRRLRIERDGGEDLTKFDRISPDVAPADLAVPEPS